MEGRIYTRARRQPWVLGKLGKDWVLPWVLTSEEIVALVGVVGLLFVTRGVWANFGIFFNTLIFAVSVTGTVALLRHLRPEGRSVRAFLRGVGQYGWQRATRKRPEKVRIAWRRLYAAEVAVAQLEGTRHRPRRFAPEPTDEETALALARAEVDAVDRETR